MARRRVCEAEVAKPIHFFFIKWVFERNFRPCVAFGVIGKRG
jgi:hypothetical protein